MNAARTCCNARPNGEVVKVRSEPAAGIAGRALEFAGWAATGAGVLLVPKCPACIAAYVAVATGIGLSMSSAAYLRVALLLACLALFIFLASRQILKSVTRWSQKKHLLTSR